MSDGLVIIGAGLAGARAAEGARAAGWEDPITLVGAEDHLPYERPPLSKAVLLGADEPASAEVQPAQFYADNDIDLVLGVRAAGLRLDDSGVTLADGTALRFDRLVLATGSSPRRLQIPGADLQGVHTLRTVDDSLALREALRPGVRAVMIGASWIGTEVAAVARQRGAEVTLVDPLGTPLERVLGPEVGAVFADLHRGHGVQLRLGVGVEAVDGSGHVTGVRLADGSLVPADLAVIGVGIELNVDLAREAGLAVGHGVLVDAALRTDHPHVYAAGDIAEHDHPVFGRRVHVEHWANARNQGALAGANAAGGDEPYDRIPYFFSDQYDLGMEYSGWPAAWDRVVFRGRPEGGAFVAFYLAGQRVVGGANINVWDVNEHVQRLVRSGQPVDPAVLADEGVDPSTWA